MKIVIAAVLAVLALPVLLFALAFGFQACGPHARTVNHAGEGL
jgi:hypothetical protein